MELKLKRTLGICAKGNPRLCRNQPLIIPIPTKANLQIFNDKLQQKIMTLGNNPKQMR